jgi:S-adenosylmethionine-dependent methyltransferase
VQPFGVQLQSPAHREEASMVDRRRRSVRTALVAEALRVALAGSGRPGALQIVDIGGGTGGFAVPLAVEGHTVTVIDPSPDALASLERRARDEGVQDRVRGVQGDTAELLAVAGEASADAVLCHGVLEVVDDPAQALQAMSQVLRPGGVFSLLVAQRNAVVLARALAGHLAEAHEALLDPDGRWGVSDPMPRRFDEAGVSRLLEDSGLQVHTVHGVRTFADLVPSAFVDSEPGAAEALAELERAASQHPAFRAIATQLHVIATR